MEVLNDSDLQQVAGGDAGSVIVGVAGAAAGAVIGGVTGGPLGAVLGLWLGGLGGYAATEAASDAIDEMVEADANGGKKK